MDSTAKEKIALVQREYTDLYEGVREAVEAGNLPQLWGLSSERATTWGYETPKDADSIIVILYDELANLGRFGEDARLENYAFQLIQEGSYSVLNVKEDVLSRFVATYGVLLWAILVSSESEGQKNTARALFIIYGTNDEKKSALRGVKKLPKTILDTINDIHTARLIVEAAPKLLTVGPITAANYLERLASITRWEALALESQGLFLSDDPSLRKGLLTRYYEHAKTLPKRFRWRENMLVGYAANHLLPTEIIEVNSESVETLDALLGSRYSELFASDKMHWEDYNPENDEDRKLSREAYSTEAKFYGLRDVDPTHIFTSKQIKQLYTSFLGWNARDFVTVARSPYFDIDLFLSKALLDQPSSRWVLTVVQHEDLFDILNPRTDEKAAILWTNATLGAPSSFSLVSAHWTPDWTAVVSTLQAVVKRAENPDSSPIIDAVRHMHPAALHDLLTQTPIAKGDANIGDILLDLVDAFIAESHGLPSMKKLMLFAIKHHLYDSEERVKNIMKTLSVKRTK